MYYKLYLAAVCEPNGGGAIGGVCQLEVRDENDQLISKPEVIKVYEAPKVGNNNFVGNYLTLQKGLERFKELVEAAKEPNPQLMILTNFETMIKQMQGVYRINISSYSPYANACIAIFSDVWGAVSRNIAWVKVETSRLSNALVLAKAIITQHAQTGTNSTKPNE